MMTSAGLILKYKKEDIFKTSPSKILTRNIPLSADRDGETMF